MQEKLTKSKVYFAGMCSLVITMGVARFSYTPMIPIMQSGTGLSELAAGWLATASYTGYMLGVFMAASMNNLKQKYRLHQICLLLGIVTAGAMALTTDLVIWSILRFFAGLCGVGGGIIASGLVLKWLIHNKHRGELDIHFAGVGFSIILVSLLVEALLHFAASWQQQWVALSVLAVAFAVPAFRWMPPPMLIPIVRHL